MSLRKLSIAAALAAVPVLAGCGQPASGGSTVSAVASADPAGSPSPAAATSAPGDTGRPSACRPADHRGVITQDQPSAGHLHYRVTLTAAPGFEPCTLVGVPTHVEFHSPGGSLLGVEATPEAGQSSPVTFGPGHDVHFDLQVRNQPGGAQAGSVTFVLNTPQGEIPGEQEASGSLAVDVGTQIGPVQAA